MHAKDSIKTIYYILLQNREGLINMCLSRRTQLSLARSYSEQRRAIAEPPFPVPCLLPERAGSLAAVMEDNSFHRYYQKQKELGGIKQLMKSCHRTVGKRSCKGKRRQLAKARVPSEIGAATAPTTFDQTTHSNPCIFSGDCSFVSHNFMTAGDQSMSTIHG